MNHGKINNKFLSFGYFKPDRFWKPIRFSITHCSLLIAFLLSNCHKVLSDVALYPQPTAEVFKQLYPNVKAFFSAFRTK